MELTNTYRASERILEAPEAIRNPIVKHWVGGYGLGVAYWVNTVLVGLAADFGMTSLQMRFPMPTPAGMAFSLAGYTLLMTIIGVWQLVGLWRSAEAHPARGGHKLWAVLAKVVVVASWMAMVGSIITFYVFFAEGLIRLI